MSEERKDVNVNWSTSAEDYDLLNPFTQVFSKECISWLKLPHVIENSTILDVAAGTGSFALTVAQEYERGEASKIIATDVSPGMIGVLSMKCARELPAEKQSWITNQVMDAQELDIADNTVDHIGCFFGVMFFADRVKAFREMLRVLKPGGTAAIAFWRDNELLPLVERAAIESGRITPEQTPLPFTQTALAYADANMALRDLAAAGFPEDRLELRLVEGQHDFAVGALARAMGMCAIPPASGAADAPTPLTREFLDRFMAAEAERLGTPGRVVIRGAAHAVLASKPPAATCN